MSFLAETLELNMMDSIQFDVMPPASQNNRGQLWLVKVSLFDETKREWYTEGFRHFASESAVRSFVQRYNQVCS